MADKLKPKLVVCVATFNRPSHLLGSLHKARFLSKWFNVSYIFHIDGCRTQEDIELVSEVSNILTKFAAKEDIIIRQPKNIGLKASILNLIGCASDPEALYLILEDDIELLPEYFNPKIVDEIRKSNVFCLHTGNDFDFDNFQILSGYNFSCWGWFARGHILAGFLEFVRNESLISIFFNCVKSDQGGLNNNSIQLINNLRGKRSTWACYFASYLAKIEVTNVFPTQSMCKNIGFDESGESGVRKNWRRIEVDVNNFGDFRLNSQNILNENQTFKRKAFHFLFSKIATVF